MSFPWHDQAWREAAEYIGPLAHRGERVLAPDAFWSIVSRVERFVPENVTPEVIRTPTLAYDWVVLDVDDLTQVPRAFLEEITRAMTPVFANDRFLIWTTHGARKSQQPDLQIRVGGFVHRLSELPDTPSEPNRYVLDAALEDASTLARYGDLSATELRATMNDLYRRTGYLYPTVRDQAYHRDVHLHVEQFLARRAGGRALDLCSGGLRHADVPDGLSLVRTEFSEVGLEQGRVADEARPGISYVVMDAHEIAFPDASFDCAMLIDSIEHLHDAGQVICEASRVLVAGGEFLITFANRNSIHQLITEKLGYPGWFTNHQHILEFTLADVTKLLDDAGFAVRETSGVTLYPYWGVPGMEFVRAIMDEDPEFVEVMAELGRRVGAEYAYTGVVRAQRV